jgi:hypothetical protein
MKEEYRGYGSPAYLKKCKKCKRETKQRFLALTTRMRQIATKLKRGETTKSRAQLEEEFPLAITIAQQVYEEAGLSLGDYLFPQGQEYMKQRAELFELADQ